LKLCARLKVTFWHLLRSILGIANPERELTNRTIVVISSGEKLLVSEPVITWELKEKDMHCNKIQDIFFVVADKVKQNGK